MSRNDVLEVLESFDRLGGASRELVAWELMVNTNEVSVAWDSIRDDGLIRENGVDPEQDESMFRLTSTGWAEWLAFGRE